MWRKETESALTTRGASIAHDMVEEHERHTFQTHKMKTRTLCLVGILVACCVLLLSLSTGILELKDSGSLSVDRKSSWLVRVPALRHHKKWGHNVDNKPLFVLHVGPAKTGTTTIQWFAAEQEELLQKDNIYYLGHWPSEKNLHRLYNFCVLPEKMNDELCNRKWAEFETEIDKHHAQNHNILVSEELFSNIILRGEDSRELLLDRLVPLQHKWRVRVIFTHRRYFEWLPSRYYQNYKPDTKSDMVRKQSWPDEGGGTIMSLPQYIDQFLKAEKNPLLWLKKSWDAQFSDVRVFNMHDNDNFVGAFFCEMIPEARQICDHVWSQPSVTVKKNMSTNKALHFDMLAVEAYKRGWIDKSLSRLTVAREIEAFSSKLEKLHSMAGFPLLCLSKNQTESLLDQTISIEREMIPEFSPAREAEIRSKFAQALEERKFCSVDVDKALEDKRWQMFFKSLMVPDQSNS